MNNSSLFMFNKDWMLRQILLVIVAPQEDVVSRAKAEELPEKYGIDDISSSQIFSHIHINAGKILPKTKLKIYSRIFEYFIIVVILLSCIIL